MLWQQTVCLREVHECDGAQGRLLLGDAASADLNAYAEKAQCVYFDPPFLTGEKFSLNMRVGEEGWKTGKPALSLPAFSDQYLDGEQYLSMLRAAIVQARLLLNDTGSFFLHLDSRMVAQARLLCDEIFGARHFVNEIIWAYQSGGRSLNRFSRKHDIILFYRKTKAHFFNITAVPIKRSENRSNHMKKAVDAQGRACRTIRSGGKIYTYYDDDPVYPGDVWTDVSHLQQKDPQRTGYDTQKPLALLNRIILSTTRENDLVADLFCGSGTTAAAAAQAGRCYLALDREKRALTVTRKRLLGTAMTFDVPTEDMQSALDANIMPGIGYYDFSLNDYRAEGIPEWVRGLDGVDQWSAGLLSDGVFYAYDYAARRKQSPSLPPVLQAPRLRGIPAILIVDIFGRRTLYIQNPVT